MPELPDVEVFRRYLVSTSLRKKIRDVTVRHNKVLGNVSARKLHDALLGRSFVATKRHGKHLFVRFEKGAWLAMHFGMTGYLRYFTDQDPEPKYDRVVFAFAGRGQLGYYSLRLLGRLDLVADPEREIARLGLGPDALDPALDLATFRARLGGGRAIIKAALMKQQAIAGMGNIYSDEILFQARIHPATRVGDLGEAQIKTLFRVMQRVLRKAIECGAEPARLPKSWILPRRSTREPCPRCGTALARLRQGARSAYFCPRCQPAS
jgi:formamidopyrimidine-DNA glycosylase